MTKIWLHPFKEGIYGLLRKHFAEPIVKDFILIFEKDIYHKDNKNIWNQMKDNNLVLEVRYKSGYETSEYICDLYSWESKERTEAQLLARIRDAVKAGKIGKDWVAKEGMISEGVIEKHDTKDKQNTGN